MTLEEIIALGVPKENAEKIVKLWKETLDGNFIPKAKFNEQLEANKTLKTQVDERDKQIKELGAFKGTAEELQSKVTTLETTNKEQAEKFQKDLTAMQNSNAVRMEIAGKVYDPDDVLSKLDVTKINFKDGKVESGLKEQLDALKTSHAHYFKADDSQHKSTFNGFKPFGKTPEEGGDHHDEGKDPQAEFGKSLADSVLAGAQAAQKANDYYFK